MCNDILFLLSLNTLHTQNKTNVHSSIRLEAHNYCFRIVEKAWSLFNNKIQKHFQNVMLVGMASEISKNYTYKCVDRSRHNGIKGAKAKCAH